MCNNHFVVGNLWSIFKASFPPPIFGSLCSVPAAWCKPALSFCERHATLVKAMILYWFLHFYVWDIDFFSFLLSFRLFCMFFLPHILWKKGMRGIKKREREGNSVVHKCCAHGFQQAKNHLVSCCCFLVICIDSVSWHLLASALPSIFCLFVWMFLLASF